MIEGIVRTLASRGPVIESDVRRACASQGIRSLSEGEIGDSLRALADDGEIVPSGRFVDPVTREVLFVTRGPERPSKQSPSGAEYRRFASALGVDAEETHSVSVPVTPSRPSGVSEAEEAEYRMFRRALGEA